MKYRTGFVSNSSSSSFMGGIGVITNYEKFEKWKSSFDQFIQSDINIYDKEDTWGELKETDNFIRLRMPVNSEPEINISKKEIEDCQNGIPVEQKAKNKLLNNHFNVVYFVIGNDEGDSAFVNYDGGDIDYDIDLDFFDKDQKRLYEEFGSDKSGVICVDRILGADRNG
ncbi:MAG: hypothetical protein ACOCQD_02045 [archaeon]